MIQAGKFRCDKHMLGVHYAHDTIHDTLYMKSGWHTVEIY